MLLPDPEAMFFVCGPTASGKSALALQLAASLDGEIVNADAFQLYRGLETLTAAPSPADLAARPHHLYSILDPLTPVDAMGYLRRVTPLILDLQQRGKTAVVTGGSGLYLKFLSHGPSPLPPGDPGLREELDRRPLEDLVRQLAELDPLEASRTPSANRRYVSRALEICLLTGDRCSGLRDRWAEASRSRESRLRGCVIRPDRATLHRRIHLRTSHMLLHGAIEEVAAYPRVAPTVEKAIGYREIRDLLDHRITRDECLERIDAATRQYAKRQETWFRRESWLTPRPL